MKYSIVIPTRNRVGTAPFAVQTAVECIGSHKEVIVVDNGDSEELRDVLADKGLLQNVTYVKTPTVLSMSVNWELGLSYTTGEYVAFMGDDDAITPYALCAMDEFIAKVDVDVVHCRTPTYNWPDLAFQGKRNAIYIDRDLSAVTLIKEPAKLIEDVFSFDWNMGTGPGVYHGFVKRAVIDRVKQDFGNYFFHEAPDLSSGFASLMYASNIIRGTYPLFLAGHCAASNSGSLHMFANYSSAMGRFKSESGAGTAEQFEFPKTNAGYLVSSYIELLPKIEEVMNRTYSFDKVKAFNLIANKIFSGHEKIHLPEIKRSLKALAAYWELPADIAIPENFSLSMGKAQTLGFVAGKKPDGSLMEMSVYDLSHLGVTDIVGALKFLQTLLPIPICNGSSTKLDFSKLFLSSNMATLENARKQFGDGDYEMSVKYYEKYLETFSTDAEVFNELGEVFLVLADFSNAAACFARAFSLKKTTEAFEKYILSLVENNQIVLAKQLLDSHCAETDDLSKRTYFSSLVKKFKLTHHRSSK